MTELKAPFTVDTFDASAYDEPADGPPLGRARLTKTYTGPLVGTATLEMLTCGQEGYTAIERFVGTFGDRAGSVAFLHGGLMGGPYGEAGETFAHVVPGSGTGGLAGMTGRGVIEHGLLTLDYDLT